jgi:NADH:ubiquinone oxidoreductase subunit 4 (subunit M)
LVGQLYQRIHSRNITEVRGLAATFPILSFFIICLFLANISFPLTLNFTGEFSFISAFSKIFGIEIIINKEISFIYFAIIGVWWVILIYSIILNGIVSVRFITILLFSTKDIPFYDGTQKFFQFNNIKLEDAKLYEVVILAIIVLALIFTAIFFVDISVFFDPNISYSTRSYRSRY